jgi:ribosomal protein L37AE/L43A
MNIMSYSGQTTSLDLYYTPKKWDWTEITEYPDWCVREDRITRHQVVHVKVNRRYRPQMYLACRNCGQAKTRIGAPWCHWPRMAAVDSIHNRLTGHKKTPPHECPKCHMNNMARDPYEVKGWKCLSCGQTLTRNQAKDYAGTVHGTGNSRLET